MSNILDYINWRGDLSFEASAFNEVDNLILSQLAYVDFACALSEGENKTLPLREAAARVAESFPNGFIPKGLMKKEEMNELLKLAGESVRFGDVEIFMPHCIIDKQNIEQFYALTFIIGDGSMYIAFRGTDQSVAGWQEDFNMAFISPIPSQNDSAEYVEKVALLRSEKIITGGHSKGGNLAVYAAAFAQIPAERIIRAYSDDGPGFPENIIHSAEYEKALDKVLNIVPQGSIVGMLLEHKGEIMVVKSSQRGISQHDGFSWSVMGKGFETLPCLDKRSVIVDNTLTKWIAALSIDERREFTAALFEILSSSGVESLELLPSDAVKLLKSIKVMPPKTREILSKAVKMLKDQAIETAKSLKNGVLEIECKR